MSDHEIIAGPEDEEAARALLDRLLQESLLYRSSRDYKELLDFVGRLRGFAPFNAMLLQIQKPGLGYAASAKDWMARFGRYPKEGARPLLIMWPFGPVALVYDVVDTEGNELPEDVSSFVAQGDITADRMSGFGAGLGKRHIDCHWVDDGDQKAGLIRLVHRATDDKDFSRYRIHINRNHSAPVQFATLVHELGHLFLGHLGKDKKLHIPERPRGTHAQRELEAESVAYILCERNGVESKSQTYLANFVTENTSAGSLDIYQILRAAGQVEQILNLSATARFSTSPRQKVALPAYGGGNRFFTRLDYTAARSRLLVTQGAGQTDSSSRGMLDDGITVSGFHAEAGAVRYRTNLSAVVTDLGAWAEAKMEMWYHLMTHDPRAQGIAGLDRGAELAAAFGRPYLW